jgi:hypothetical protein
MKWKRESREYWTFKTMSKIPHKVTDLEQVSINLEVHEVFMSPIEKPHK